MSKIALRVYTHEIETLVDQGHIDEAIAHCQHILKTYPKHLETYRMLGKAYLEAHRHSDAADIFQRVLTAVPDDFVAHLGMSIVHDEQKNLDQAIWHMERAYEANPSNGGVQAELRRLYGRRDGLEPPKIQLTRGALARMYIRGRQYDQAVQEIKSVLQEDSERLDMKVLLAQAYFRAGQKVEATEICTEILQASPYCFDANRILVEILPGTSMASSVDTYKKRLQQLDPYIAMALHSTFDVASVQDSAVGIERLEWDPSMAHESLDGDAQFESEQAGTGEAIPEWMKDSGWGPSSGEFQESPVDFDEPDAAPGQEPGELAAAEIPDWLKAMAPPGTGEVVAETGGAEEESADLEWLAGIGAPAAVAADMGGDDFLSGLGADGESAESAAPVAESAGEDVPEWLAGMGAEDESAAAPAQPATEDVPDFLSALGVEDESANPAAESAGEDVPEWLAGMGTEDESAAEPAQPATEDVPDFLSGLGVEDESVNPAAESAGEDVPDFLSGLGAESESTEPAQPATEDIPDFLSGLGAENDSAEPAQPAAEIPDWLAGIEAEGQKSETFEDTSAWLASLDSDEKAPAGPAEEQQPAAPAADVPDWLAGLGAESELAPETTESAEPSQPVAADDADDWLAGLGSDEKSPAAGETIADEQPAAPAMDVPDWLTDLGAESELATEVTEPTDSAQPAAADDAGDWLAGLGSDVEPAAEAAESAQVVQPAAADDTDDWLAGLGADVEPAAEEEPAAQAEPALELPGDMPEMEESEVGELSALISGPGTSESEQDEAFKWLESLAAGQGAKPEELLTQPEERLEHSPDWVASVDEAPPAPAAKPAEFVPEPPIEVGDEEPLGELSAPVREGPGTSELDQDDAFKWLESLAAGQGAKPEELLTQPEERLDHAPDWVGEVENPPPPLSPPVSAPGTSELDQDDSFKWLENLAAGQGAKPEELLTKPEERLDHSPDWLTEVGDQPQDAAPAVDETPAVEEETPVAAEPVSELPEAALPHFDDDEDLPPAELSSLVAGPGTTESEQDDAFKWLESLAAGQGAKPEELLTQPEERLEHSPGWVAEVGNQPEAPAVPPEPQPVEEQVPVASEEPAFPPAVEEEPETPQEEPAPAETMEEPSLTEPVLDWFSEPEPEPEQPVPVESQAEPARPLSFASDESDVSDWLQSLDQDETPAAVAETPALATEEDLPEWLKDEAADELPPQPEHVSGWVPAEESEPALEADADSPEAGFEIPETAEQAPAGPAPVPFPVEESAAAPEEIPAPAAELETSPPAPALRPATRQTGMLGGDKDAMLLQRSRLLLEKSNLDSAMTEYTRLIKKGKYMEEIIFDLQEATYQHPVDVVVWQTLGDAYMRANRLQEALDSYTKAEELLR
jgi:tetratricopeptide (TPR) repeat protein